MITLLELIFSMSVLTVCMMLCYRAGFRKGVQAGSMPDVNFLKDIKLPTSDEIIAGTNRRFWDNEAIKKVFNS
jgi:hypothetical protein